MAHVQLQHISIKFTISIVTCIAPNVIRNVFSAETNSHTVRGQIFWKLLKKIFERFLLKRKYVDFQNFF